MKKKKSLPKRILLGSLLVLFAIQFVRPAKNISSTPPGKDDMIVRFAPPPEVRRMLEVGCYDCHSNTTRYPWYSQIQPTAWWLAKHITDGKNQLNFSEFAGYSTHDQLEKLDSLVDELDHRTMPLKSFTWIHRDAIFTDAQIKAFDQWAEGVREKIEADK